MVLDLHELPAWIGEPCPYPVRRITRASETDWYRQVAEDVFGEKNPLVVEELIRAVRSGSTNHLGYVAFDGEEPVSIGRLYTHPESAFGGLYGGGTAQSHRGRGLYWALVAARARDASQLGAISPSRRDAHEPPDSRTLGFRSLDRHLAVRAQASYLARREATYCIGKWPLECLRWQRSR